MRRVYALLLTGLLSSCASTGEGLGEGGDAAVGAAADAPLKIVDGATGAVDAVVGAFPDAARPADAMIRYDAAIVSEFNGPCHDRSECTTGICILASSGGYCSML